jgi:hypothetical protein
MEKRVCKRITAGQEVIFSYDKIKRFGTLINCSEKGMYIKPSISSPVNPAYEIRIPHRGELLRIPGRVVRVVKNGDCYDGFGLELTKLSKSYLKYLIKLDLIHGS